MGFLLQESGRLVGVVVNVVNYGASDLLQVMLNSTNEKVDYSNSSKPDIGASGQVVWVPFVEAIVPEVDMDKREMCITPPKGLLELNLRTDLRTKKERHQLVRSASFRCFSHIYTNKKISYHLCRPYILVFILCTVYTRW